jgi:beta-lactamase class A
MCLLRGKALIFTFLLLFGNLAHCFSQSGDKDFTKLLADEFGKRKGTYAVACKDLNSGEIILVNPHESFHAASTMKTPVMIEVYKQAAQGVFAITDSILLKNEFKSIVDGSLYSQDSTNDSERELYKHIGRKAAIKDLVYQMIIMSSNFATDLVIDKVGAKKVTQTMREMGAKDIQVLRGVEDTKAFQKGLNNTVTAYDLMLLYEQMALGRIVSEPACKEMIEVLLDQKFNYVIPANLPEEVRVAHKTGSITGVMHDSGIVFLPDSRKYVLVILSRDFEDSDQNIAFLASVSKRIYDHLQFNR